jgi:glycosyltransferase involved in cell wall biosynthesis
MTGHTDQSPDAPGPRICIVTPGQIGSNPRVVKEAQALHEAGLRVHVIATRTLDIVEPRDQSLMQRIPWRLERIDMRSRLGRKLRRLAQAAAQRAYGATGAARLADFGFSAVTGKLAQAAVDMPADLYIAHYPAALPAAAAAARHHGALLSYDVEDFHLGDWPEAPAYDTKRRLVRAIEGRYLGGCAFVTAASPGIADALVEAYGIARPHVVHNVFPLDQAPAAPTPAGTAVPGPSVYWFSQTIGPNRGLECAVRAIGLAVLRPHLFLRGTLAAGYEREIRALADAIGVGDRLHLLAPAVPDEMERLAAAYDIGLVAETAESRNRGICLTNKLFSFLLAGVPPVMSDTPAHRRFAFETGLSDLIYPLEEPAALAGRFDGLLGNPEKLAAARDGVWRLGQERYNWDREKAAIVDLVRAQGLQPTMASNAAVARQRSAAG